MRNIDLAHTSTFLRHYGCLSFWHACVHDMCKYEKILPILSAEPPLIPPTTAPPLPPPSLAVCLQPPDMHMYCNSSVHLRVCKSLPNIRCTCTCIYAHIYIYMYTYIYYTCLYFVIHVSISVRL